MLKYKFHKPSIYYILPQVYDIYKNTSTNPYTQRFPGGNCNRKIP